MLARIGNLALKDIIQLVRDRLMLTFIILGPVLELVLLAHSTGHGITDLPVVVVDYDRSQLSRQIIAAIDNTEELQVVAYLDSYEQMNSWLERNQATLAIILPVRLEAKLVSRRMTPQVQLMADGTNNVTGSYALNAASGAIQALLTRRRLTEAGLPHPLDLHIQVRYNPTLNVQHFTITAQLGFIVYQVTLIIAALGLARERELGTLEQLLVTPMQRLELIIGKAIPAIIIASIDLILMWAIVVWGFKVPMRGSLALLLGLSFLFIIAEIGWGLTISTMARTQQQAVLMVFVLAMVDVSFSGYLVPVERLPATLRTLAQVFPLEHYLTIIRQIMLKGVHLADILNEAVGLVALGLASHTIAAISLQRRLD